MSGPGIGHNSGQLPSIELSAASFANSSPALANVSNKRKFRTRTMTPSAVRKRRSREAAAQGLSQVLGIRISVRTYDAYVVDLKARRVSPTKENIAAAITAVIEASPPRPPARKR